MRIRLLAIFSLVLWIGQGSIAAAAPVDAKTRVVILGVDHSAQLVSKSYRPAVVEAFIDRVKPDALCIERDPDDFAMGDFYEFTYEVTEIAIPYARDHHVPLCPIDWIPPKQDMVLAFGLDLDAPPLLRPAKGFQAFLSFPDAVALHRGLFWAEDRAALAEWDAFADEPPKQPGAEISRRLFLYRTALQARRIAQAARLHRGGTLLVIVGAYHERDIKSLLSADPQIDLVEARTYGEPSPEESTRADRPRYLVAALTFNLLGQQATTGQVDWAWMGDMLDQLEARGATPETRLLRLRLQRLSGKIDAKSALKAYQSLWASTPDDAAFTWTGVKDRQRLDSFFDPFGNMTVGQRIRLEIGRELIALGRIKEAEAMRDALVAALTPAKSAQLRAYWASFVVSAKAS